MQALVSTEEMFQGGGPVPAGAGPANVDGSHGRSGRFNVVFADGHADSVWCRKSGDMYDLPRSDGPLGTGASSLRWRSPAWHYDNLPAPTLKGREYVGPGTGGGGRSR